jgi:hypothetical protein
VVGSDGDRRFARRVSGRETVELSARMSENDAAIGHDRAGSSFLRPGDDDRVDAVLGEKPGAARRQRVDLRRSISCSISPSVLARSKYARKCRVGSPLR